MMFRFRRRPPQRFKSYGLGYVQLVSLANFDRVYDMTHTHHLIQI